MNYSIRLIACSLALFASTQLNAQQTVLIKQDSTKKIQTLFQGKINSFGLSVSPTFQFGPMGPQAGMALALHLNNKWEIGGSFTRSLRGNRDDFAMAPQLGQQFHALSIAYTAKANKLIHLSFPLLIGAITSRNEVAPIGIMDPNTQPNPIMGGHGGMRDGGMFWDGPKSLGIQPGVQVELNVLKHLRVFTGANYRFAVGENSTDAMRGFVGTVGLKVGLFDRSLKTKKK
ncbi:hypothetical protein [Aquirufa echingensis]|uniref:Outer membrane protein beta-barrel domain-containing protein n=1 Tax=Aquirufa echingensis TaxID=3096516 RepID=A0ABW6D0I1_9BACT